MALPGKITWEIEYSFPAVGLHYHQEDKTINCGRLRKEKQVPSSTSLHVERSNQVANLDECQILQPSIIPASIKAMSHLWLEKISSCNYDYKILIIRT